MTAVLSVVLNAVLIVVRVVLITEHTVLIAVLSAVLVTVQIAVHAVLIVVRAVLIAVHAILVVVRAGLNVVHVGRMSLPRKVPNKMGLHLASQLAVVQLELCTHPYASQQVAPTLLPNWQLSDLNFVQGCVHHHGRAPTCINIRPNIVRDCLSANLQRFPIRRQTSHGAVGWCPTDLECGRLWVRIPSKVLRVDEGETRGELSSAGIEGRGKRETRREKPPTSGIVCHVPHLPKSGATRPGIAMMRGRAVWISLLVTVACSQATEACRNVRGAAARTTGDTRPNAASILPPGHSMQDTIHTQPMTALLSVNGGAACCEEGAPRGACYRRLSRGGSAEDKGRGCSSAAAEPSTMPAGPDAGPGASLKRHRRESGTARRDTQAPVRILPPSSFASAGLYVVGGGGLGSEVTARLPSLPLFFVAGARAAIRLAAHSGAKVGPGPGCQTHASSRPSLPPAAYNTPLTSTLFTDKRRVFLKFYFQDIPRLVRTKLNQVQKIAPKGQRRTSMVAQFNDILPVTLLASHQGEPSSIPGRVTPRFSHVGIVLVDGFPQGSPVLLALSFRRCSILTSITPSALKTSRLRTTQISSLRGPLRQLTSLEIKGHFFLRLGATVAERLARSPPIKANRAQSPAGLPDFRKWESCRTMTLVCRFSRGSPASPAPSFRRRSIFTSTTLIGSQGRPNLFNSLFTLLRPRGNHLTRQKMAMWALRPPCEIIQELPFHRRFLMSFSLPSTLNSCVSSLDTRHIFDHRRVKLNNVKLKLYAHTCCHYNLSPRASDIIQLGTIVAEWLDCSPLTKFNYLPGRHRIFENRNRAGRCRWSTGFLGDLPFPQPLHSSGSLFSPRFTFFGSQHLIKNAPNLSTVTNSILFI
ncbi:hypothetical protein PR048_012251 [Dryococelus australis]|uniref:Uncharacterized protein n=1 Tax=Dryococelus australis TaxID=614101 RepID=A0ABQ9HPD7_9NEOP|nr:hypothetical protein PR048_012251 [Dryococelus australis]